MEEVVIKDPVVNPLAGSTLGIYLFVFLGTPGNPWEKAEIVLVLDIYGTSKAAGGTLLFMRACIYPAAFQRAAVLMCMPRGLMPPGDHPVPAAAVGDGILAEGDVLRGRGGMDGPAVDVNEGVNAPPLKQLIGGHVVVGRVEADVPGRQARGVAAEIVDGVEEVQAVMPFCAGKLKGEGEFHLEIGIPAAEHVE